MSNTVAQFNSVLLTYFHTTSQVTEIKLLIFVLTFSQQNMKFLQDTVHSLSLRRGNNFTPTSLNNLWLYSHSWLAAEFNTSARKKGIDIPGLFLVKKWTKASSKCLSFASCFCPVLKLDIHKK